jgi:type I restriction enzyme S subunit
MAVNLDNLPLPDELPPIPDGWRYESLGNLVEERGVSYGIVQPGSETTNGVPIVRVNNIREGRIDTTDILKVKADIEAKFQRSRLRGGEVLLTLVGTLGEVAIVPDELRGWNVARAVGVIPVRKDPGNLWVSICLRSAFIQHCIRTWATTTVQATFNLRDLAKLPIPIPPKKTREAIAGVLGALDDKIELNRRMNATLEAMARALFQSWFIDFDPVRRNMDRNQPSTRPSGHPSPSGRRDGDEGASGLLNSPATDALFPDSFQDSPLGPIPKGWTAGKLGDIGTNSRRGVQPSEIAPNTPYIALEHMPRRCIALGDWDESADVASGKSAFKKGEVLFGKLRPYFHKVGVAPFDGVCSTDILVLAPKSPEWFGFLLGHASSDALIQFTDLASTGTKMPRTNWNDISSFKVALPPKPIAAAFTKIIQPLLDRIHANLHQSRTLATLRDTLLPKLLSGELSVANGRTQTPIQT